MIEGLKPYPVMKDSGVQWLGIVPEHWNVLPNRALFVEVKDREHPDEEMLSVTITKGVVYQKTLLAESSKKDITLLRTFCRSARPLAMPSTRVIFAASLRAAKKLSSQPSRSFRLSCKRSGTNTGENRSP
jgi:hypothetical protein